MTQMEQLKMKTTFSLYMDTSLRKDLEKLNKNRNVKQSLNQYINDILSAYVTKKKGNLHVNTKK
jgi:hypothetical protein